MVPFDWSVAVESGPAVTVPLHDRSGGVSSETAAGQTSSHMNFHELPTEVEEPYRLSQFGTPGDGSYETGH